MKIILSKNKLVKFIYSEKNLGFVPTMGAIHKGHISLFKKSISQNNKTVVSIFINKPQFSRKSDFQKYPRVLKNDILKIKKLKIDYLFLPSVKQIYPDGRNKNIKISSFGKKLCGKFRPGHFEAVADVLDRFIKIIRPKKIYLGEKDMQQLKIVEHFVKKEHPGIKVVGCKTIRKKNGIACSSRNFLLSTKESLIASQIYKIIVEQKKNVTKKNLSLDKLKNKIYLLGVNKIDYLEMLDVNKLIKPFLKKNNYKIFIAYYLGKTRLIDNI
mgnify:CR=1 FL=1